MITVAPDRRSVLAGLFAGHKRQRILIDGGLEGRYGTAMADSAQEPRLARLTVAAFTMCAGDPGHPVASEIITHLPGTIFVPETEAWRDLMIRIHDERLSKHQRIDFSSERLDMDHLQTLRSRVPEGFEVQRIDTESVHRLGYDMDLNYLPPMRMRYMVEHGIGFWAISGNRWASVAYSYVICRAGITIQIETRPEFRRKGLATCVAAALIAHCLERGLEPHWSAANPISAALAEKLGYVQSDSYECLWPEFRPVPDFREVGYLQPDDLD